MKISAGASNSIERVSVKNALNPILWICGLISAPATLAAAFVTNPSWILETLAIGPIAVASFAYLHLLFFDCDRLPSESFQLVGPLFKREFE
jgi:hypothetical protein